MGQALIFFTGERHALRAHLHQGQECSKDSEIMVEWDNPFGMKRHALPPARQLGPNYLDDPIHPLASPLKMASKRVWTPPHCPMTAGRAQH